MNDEKEIREKTMIKPRIFIKNIIFNDGTVLELGHDSIVIFTGANNSGKSQVLKDIELCIRPNVSAFKVLRKAEYEYCGNINEENFLRERFSRDVAGKYVLSGFGGVFTINDLMRFWTNHTLYNGLDNLFVKRLSTEMRLVVSNSLQRNDQPESHPIYKIYKSESLAQKLSNYFYQAFSEDLVVNRNEMQTIPLHVGKAPNKTKYTIDKQDDYYSQVDALPKLQEQGDGMRSFASILLDTFASNYSITLIDEPEAFLHPPQARVLGKMLAKNNPEGRQLFLSTHSEDFLQGLLDADSENVIVVRINRVNNINNMKILKTDDIRSLWSNPILRYSNILSGIFHTKVVVCESDYDCLFYQALINAIYEIKSEVAPDILFTHCGGKCRIKDVIKALKAVDVPVMAICDFDILNDSRNIKEILKSFGYKWDNIADKMKIIYDEMNGKSGVGEDAWSQIKRIGKTGFTGDAPAAYEIVETECRKIGLYIVPVGEMECFDKTVNKEKKDWVYHVLEKYNLATESKLEEARKFVQAVVDF